MHLKASILILISSCMSLYSYSANAADPCPPTGLEVIDEGSSNATPDPECGVVPEVQANSVTPPVQTNTPAPQIESANLNSLKQKADSIIQIRSSWISTASGDTTSVHGYNRWPAFDGLIDLYIATSDVSYIQLSVDMALDYIAAGTDQNGDGYLDWYNSAKGGYNHDHYEWRSASGIGKLVSLLSDHPELTQFSGNYNTMVSFLEQEVWQKWTSPSPATSGNSNIATNCTYFIGRLGQTAIGLHKATGASKYLTYINSKGGDLIDNLTSHYNSSKDAYNMTGRTNGEDVSGSPSPGTVDISHGADAISFLTTAYREGYTLSGKLDQTVMDRLTNILTNVVFTGSSFTENIDGGGGSGTRLTKSNGGWSRLALHDINLYSKYMDYVLNPNTYDGGTSYEMRIQAIGGLARVTVELETGFQ